MIEFYNLKKLDIFLHKKIIKNFKKNINKCDYILGDDVHKFEKKFSNYVGCKFGIGCANGTDALFLSLKALNLPKNSEVIIPAMTYCATAFAVINAGLKPVLVDLEKNSPLIDLRLLKKKITKKTKVILPVHLYGSVVNLDSLRKIIINYKQKIYILDDCAQAHGAILNNKKKIGSNSDISSFSLYPGKNLGAYGDAGIITTNNYKYYKILRKLRNLGAEKKFLHDMIGFNSRLDTIQASVLSIKLDYLDKFNNNRRVIAKYYDANIINKKITKLKYSKNSVYHQYVIICKDKNSLIKYLIKKKIGYGFHYPSSINKIHSLKKLFKGQVYPNAEKLAKNCISLPIDPNLTKKEIKFIVRTLNNF
jgi:dTDP-4-amino-4,6-dideoxygalactose transaminase